MGSGGGSKRLVELKARVADLGRVRAWADAEAEWVEDVEQVDTYFRVSRGRLKLREVEGRREARLIFYLREDVPGTKESQVHLVEVRDGASLHRLLREALGVRTVVRKRRRIYRHGHVQIHLDRVEGLGTFVEFERSVTAGQEEGGRTDVEALQAALGIRPDDLVAGSYSDLLLDPPTNP